MCTVEFIKQFRSLFQFKNLSLTLSANSKIQITNIIWNTKSRPDKILQRSRVFLTADWAILRCRFVNMKYFESLAGMDLSGHSKIGSFYMDLTRLYVNHSVYPNV